MLLTKKESLAGLPEIIIEAAAETAKSEEKKDGRSRFMLQATFLS